MDFNELLLTAGRAFAVYVVMLIVIRALGKRTVGNFAAFDLLVALMLGELVDEIIYGDVTFLQGTLALVVIAGAEAGNSWLSWRSPRLATLLEGSPTVIIRNGSLDREGMHAERMNDKEVMGHLRALGIGDVREVKLAIVEDDGSVSVVRRRWAEPVRRADVDSQAAAARDIDIGPSGDGGNETDGGNPNRTDAPRWLT
jgi:uncharacterized membrane protein YcaP (DUF421 family)